MSLAILALIVGLALLVWSSDRFVDGASAIAFNLGLSPLIIGLTIVGFGTSAPEMLVSSFAALEGNPALGIGNAIGSNIANIALILGVTAFFIPIALSSKILRLELPLLLAAMILGYAVILDGYLSQADGVILFLALFSILGWLVRDALKNKPGDILVEEVYEEIPTKMPLPAAIGWFLIGLVVLLISARMLVWGAVEIATAFGISDLVIGLTIVAIGTSLPELAASIASARKGDADMAVGNVIGSNLFNILGVMALPGLIRPDEVPVEAITRDYPLMLLLSLALFTMAYLFSPRERKISKIEGTVLTAIFFGYQLMLYMGSASEAI
ncbi:MAG: calcium/sodium antiporter [Thiotrichales bacterium]